jgi:RNA recognition motif-containing protein
MQNQASCIPRNTNLTFQGNYGFVEFTDAKDAEEAKTKVQGKDFGGKEINIEWSKNSGRANSKEGHRKDRRYNIS